MSNSVARTDAVERAMAHAPFLAMLAGQRQQLIDHFVAAGPDAALAAATQLDPDGDVPALLRKRRGDLSLILALADLSGDYDLTAVVHGLTDFADTACDAALKCAFAERVPGAEPQGIAVIALGKMGSRELNYSSDIDPILIFDPNTMPRRERDDPGEAAVRIARRWVDILAQRTGDGHVLRVDLRLRPTPEVTPIVLPVDAMISYYESQALAWEQAAFIRSRVSAGDMALGERFLDAIQPFIWRRSMDFGQIRRIADITDRIRDAYAGGQAFGPGFDLKRGRGGIREIEFYTQVQQLIHGGRDPALRLKDTREALAALAEAGHVAPQTATMLSNNLVTLRTIEHRLQMVDDQQTHSLPDTRECMDRVGQLHGLVDGDALLDLLRPVTDAVGATFDVLVGANDGGTRHGWPTDDDQVADRSESIGFKDGRAAARLIAGWRGGSMRVLRAPAARDALEQVLPALMQAMAEAQDPDALLIHFDRMIGGLPSAINFFNLLAARPQLLGTLMAVLGHAPTLANELASRSELIEGLIDSSVFADPEDSSEIERAMAAGPVDDLERQLDHVRRLVGERRFALGVQLVEGASDPLAVARGYSDLADAALGSLTHSTILAFEAAHGRIPEGELIILALGRYGGRALTHASDLDLILLFTGDLMAESDGRRPLGTTTYFNRLGQRVIANLSVPTAAGRLYEIDTRLRPQGNQGPLVASLEAFAQYQREDAWTWEHMALTRARVVYGSDVGRQAVEAVISETLNTPRDPAALMADIVKMRNDMAAHKPPKGALDVKLIDGGLVDAEFAIHATQLLHRTAFHPQLRVALTQLEQQGLAPDTILPAQALESRMLVSLRLMAPDGEPPSNPATRRRVAAACLGREQGDWDAMLNAYAEARQAISAWWHQLRDDAPQSAKG
jgi:glutamate-ammonia-ligase adenylyltransferase